jgi:hypothetical protein
VEEGEASSRPVETQAWLTDYRYTDGLDEDLLNQVRSVMDTLQSEWRNPITVALVYKRCSRVREQESGDPLHLIRTYMETLEPDTMYATI